MTWGSSYRAAGFELRLLTEGQGVGLMDDQLRVAKRTARFPGRTCQRAIRARIGKLDLLRGLDALSILIMRAGAVRSE